MAKTYHHQNLTYDKLPLWRHGRAWWRSFAWEWSMFHRSSIGLSLSRRSFSIRALWFAIYVSFRDREEFGGSWEMSWHDGAIWLEHPWVRQMEWRSVDPWWRKVICLHVVDWILGSWKHTCTKGEPFEVFIPMPEGSYRATATLEARVWRRRFGITKRSDGVWLDLPGCIPHSGKGENSWDCGDDGLCGTGGDTVEEAIGSAVASVLKSRRRHGHDSKGTGRDPLKVINEEKNTAGTSG